MLVHVNLLLLRRVVDTLSHRDVELVGISGRLWRELVALRVEVWQFIWLLDLGPSTNLVDEVLFDIRVAGAELLRDMASGLGLLESYILIQILGMLLSSSHFKYYNLTTMGFWGFGV